VNLYATLKVMMMSAMLNKSHAEKLSWMTIALTYVFSGLKKLLCQALSPHRGYIQTFPP
jgi:hypothetical protein